MKRAHLIWIPVGLAIALAVFALVVMFGFLNGPLKRVVETRLSEALGSEVRIDALEGNPLFEFSLSRVTWSGETGATFACGEVFVSYRPVGLLWGSVVVDSIRLASPRLRLVSAADGEDPRLGLEAIPAVELRHVVVQNGIVTVVREEAETVAEDLQFVIGFRNTGREASLQVRRLQTLVLDPPVEIENLSGLALSREDVLLFQDVQVVSPGSRIGVSGELTNLADPAFRFDLQVDSLSLAEVGQAAGIDLPAATAWLSGRVEGTPGAYGIDLEWVVGGAAGDIRLQVSGADHRVDITGREVDIAPLTGIPLRGEFRLTASGTGESPAEGVGSARAAISRGSLYGVPVDSLVADIRYRAGALTADVVLASGVGAFTGALSLDEESGTRLTGRLAGVDLSQAGGPRTRLDGDLRVTGRAERTRIVLDLGRVDVVGKDAGRLRATLSRTEARLALDALRWDGPERLFGLRGSGDLWRATDGLFALSFEGDVDPGAALGVDGPERAAFEARVWNEPLDFGATRERFDMSADLQGFFGLDSLSAAATMDGGRIVLERLVGVGEDAALTVTGDAILDSAWDLAATYRAGSAAVVPTSLTAGVTADSLVFTGTAVGPWTAPEIRLEAGAAGVAYAGAAFDDVVVEANVPVAGDGGLSIQAERARWGGRTLEGFYADLGLTGDDLSFLVGNREGTDNRLALWGGATLYPDSVAVRVDSARVQISEVSIANRGPIALSYAAASGVRVHQLYLAGPSGEMEAAPQDAAGAINVRIHDFDLAPWAFLAGLDGRLEGRLSGGVTVSGGRDWTAQAVMEAWDVRFDQFWPDTVFCDLSFQAGRAFGTAGLRVGTGSAYVEGHLGLGEDPAREIDLRFVAEAVPLAAFDPLIPQVTGIDGELSGQVWLTGPARAVETNGDLVLSSGQLTMPALKRGLTGVSAEIDFAPGAVTVTRLLAKGRSGSLILSGRVGMGPIDLDRLGETALLGELDFDILAERLDAIATPDMSATVDGRVELTGTIDAPVLAGRVALTKAEVRLLSMLEAPPDPESIWRTVPFFENLQTRLQVTAERQLWVRDEAVNVELSGDVDVLRTKEDLAARRSEELGFRFFGTMSSLRGTYRFQNRNFRIVRGNLTFVGEQPVNPNVDIHAWARIPILTGELDQTEREDFDISVLVTGSFTQSRITLAEGREPDLAGVNVVQDDGQQAELLSYILFGRGPDQLIAAEQNLLGEQSAGLVLGLATRELQNRLAASLNLDMIQVEMGSASTIDRVTVGKYISDRLFVSYEDQIGQGREFAVEYELLPRFSLESRIQDDPDRPVAPSLRLTWSRDW